MKKLPSPKELESKVLNTKRSTNVGGWMDIINLIKI